MRCKSMTHSFPLFKPFKTQKVFIFYGYIHYIKQKTYKVKIDNSVNEREIFGFPANFQLYHYTIQRIEIPVESFLNSELPVTRGTFNCEENAAAQQSASAILYCAFSFAAWYVNSLSAFTRLTGYREGHVRSNRLFHSSGSSICPLMVTDTMLSPASMGAGAASAASMRAERIIIGITGGWPALPIFICRMQ